MGYQDAMRFEEWFKEKYKRDYDKLNFDDQKIQAAYKAGYDYGWVARGNYDPRWDAD